MIQTELCRRLNFLNVENGSEDELTSLDYKLPDELEAGEPPEARGLSRDAVRLMVSYRNGVAVEHRKFHELPELLDPGDVLVINTSATRNAAVRAERDDGTALEVHLSTQLPADLWVVELRSYEGSATVPFFDGSPGEMLRLKGGGVVELHAPHRRDQRTASRVDVRLWIATLHLPQPLGEYLEQNGFPIRYGYVRQEWPLEYYQTVYCEEPGSAEMPSAGRAFTAELLTRLVAKGVQFAPLVLHTGVASLENHEPPYEEFYRVGNAAATTINAARDADRRVIAVGTTVVRALETVAGDDGRAHPGEGWTDVIIRPERELRSMDGLLTGLHEPRATHLAMLLALAGPDHVCRTYSQALEQGYLWHEFGDLHLILPGRSRAGSGKDREDCGC